MSFIPGLFSPGEHFFETAGIKLRNSLCLAWGYKENCKGSYFTCVASLKLKKVNLQTSSGRFHKCVHCVQSSLPSEFIYSPPPSCLREFTVEFKTCASASSCQPCLVDVKHWFIVVLVFPGNEFSLLLQSGFDSTHS